MDNIPEGYCQCGCGNKVKPGRRYLQAHHLRHSPVDFVEEDRGYRTPCIVWQGALTSGGYAQKRIGGKAYVMHRYRYEQLHGPLKHKEQLDHLCRVRACVNVKHLEVVTNAENTQRGKCAVATPEIVCEMRRLREKGWPVKDIAAHFEINVNTTIGIIYRITWKNV